MIKDIIASAAGGRPLVLVSVVSSKGSTPRSAGAMMSGSGPTVFGLFMSPARAEEAYEEMRYGSAASMARQVYLTRFYNRNKDADIRQGNERNGK